MIETKYKNTGCHIIPLDWEEGCLELYTSKIGSGATPTGGEASYKEEGISLIRSLNVYNDGFKYERLAHINKEQATELDNVTIEEGDVLVNITGASVARCCIVPNNILPARVNQHVSIVRTQKETLNFKFLWFLLTSPLFQKELIALSKGNGGTREALTKKQLQEFLITLPSSTDEQSRIAEALSDVDDLISTTKKLIEKKRNIKQGAMQELISGKRRLSGFKDKWVEIELGDVAQIKTGYAFKSSTYTKTGDYKIITIANVQNGQLILSECNVINEPPKDLQEHQILKIGDILVSMTGNVGRVCMVNEYACLLNQRVGIVVLTSKNIDKNFLYIALTDKCFEKEMIMKGHGAAQPNIGNRDIESYMFSIPLSIDEQQAIANVLLDMDSEISSLESRLTKYQSLKQGMMQQLLTGKIRLI